MTESNSSSYELNFLDWRGYIQNKFPTVTSERQLRSIMKNYPFIDFYLGKYKHTVYEFTTSFIQDISINEGKTVPEPSLKYLVQGGIFEILENDTNSDGSNEEPILSHSRKSHSSKLKATCVYIRKPGVEVHKSLHRILDSLRRETPGHVLQDEYYTSHEYTSDLLEKYGFSLTILRPWKRKVGIRQIINTLLKKKSFDDVEIRMTAAFWKKGGWEIGLLNRVECDPTERLSTLKMSLEKFHNIIADEYELQEDSEEDSDQFTGTTEESTTSERNQDGEDDETFEDQYDTADISSQGYSLQRNYSRYTSSTPAFSNRESNESGIYGGASGRYSEGQVCVNIQESIYYEPYDYPTNGEEEFDECDESSVINSLADSSNDDYSQHDYTIRNEFRYIPGHVRLIGSDEFEEESEPSSPLASLPPPYDECVSKDLAVSPISNA